MTISELERQAIVRSIDEAYRVMATTITEFCTTLSCGGCSFNFILDGNDAFENMPLFVITKYKKISKRL